METKYEIQLFVTGDNVGVEIKRYYVLPNGTLSPAQVWRKSFAKGDSLGETLPCLWEGDAEITELSWDMFPAEKTYLEAKLAE